MTGLTIMGIQCLNGKKVSPAQKLLKLKTKRKERALSCRETSNNVTFTCEM